MAQLQAQDIPFKSLTDYIDTSGRFFLQVMASLAEMEGELTQEGT